MIGMVTDITARKLAEEELARANDRLRMAMEAAKTIGWDRDVKTGRDTLFGALPSMFRFPSEVYEGRVEDFYRYLFPDDRGWVLDAINDAMESQEAVRGGVPHPSPGRYRSLVGSQRKILLLTGR